MSLSRNLLLAVANNPTLADRAARAAFVRRSVTRFMPGEHVEDAIAAALALRAGGIGTMLTKLGVLDTRQVLAELRQHRADADEARREPDACRGRRGRNQA